MAQSVKTVIGEVRFSYLHVFEPWKSEDDSSEKEPQYTATLLIPKTNKKLVAGIRESIRTAYEAAVTEKWGGKKPADGYWFDPLQDGDSPKQDGEPRGEAYEGCWFINAKSRNQPGVISGRTRKPIIDSEEFYSGCYGYASVAFSGFTFGKKMGISCFLNNLMKTKDGEPLGGTRANAESDFEGIVFESTDEDL